MKYILALLASFLLTGCVCVQPTLQTQSKESETSSESTINQMQLNKIEKEVEATIETTLEVYYNSANATNFDYILFVRNNGLQEIVVDVAIQEADKTIVERTIGVNPFQTKSVRGEMMFDKPALHIFNTKINRINYIGKK